MAPLKELEKRKLINLVYDRQPKITPYLAVKGLKNYVIGKTTVYRVWETLDGGGGIERKEESGKKRRKLTEEEIRKIVKTFKEKWGDCIEVSKKISCVRSAYIENIKTKRN